MAHKKITGLTGKESWIDHPKSMKLHPEHEEKQES